MLIQNGGRAKQAKSPKNMASKCRLKPVSDVIKF